MCRYKKLIKFLSDGKENKAITTIVKGKKAIQYLYKNKLKTHFPEWNAQLYILWNDNEKLIFSDGSINKGCFLLDKKTNHAVSIERNDIWYKRKGERDGISKD